MSEKKTNGNGVGQNHTSENLLDLSTFVIHDFITIDGKQYEIKNMDEFSLLELQKLTQFGRSAEILSDETKELDEKTASELSGKTKNLLKTIFVKIPDSVNDKLTDMQRFRIIEVFIRRSGLLKQQETSLQPSKDSTEEIPSAG